MAKRTSSFSQGLLAEKDFIRDQKPTLMADLLLLASEASACGAFKLKIMDPLMLRFSNFCVSFGWGVDCVLLNLAVLLCRWQLLCSQVFAGVAAAKPLLQLNLVSPVCKMMKARAQTIPNDLIATPGINLKRSHMWRFIDMRQAIH